MYVQADGGKMTFEVPGPTDGPRSLGPRVDKA